jgi:hypothetical protein
LNDLASNDNSRHSGCIEPKNETDSDATVGGATLVIENDAEFEACEEDSWSSLSEVRKVDSNSVVTSKGLIDQRT